MLLKEVFKNYKVDITDNARCLHCDSTYTISKVQAQHEPNSECPNCHGVNDSKEALDDTTKSPELTESPYDRQYNQTDRFFEPPVGWAEDDNYSEMEKNDQIVGMMQRFEKKTKWKVVPHKLNGMNGWLINNGKKLFYYEKPDGVLYLLHRHTNGQEEWSDEAYDVFGLDDLINRINSISKITE